MSWTFNLDVGFIACFVFIIGEFWTRISILEHIENSVIAFHYFLSQQAQAEKLIMRNCKLGWEHGDLIARYHGSSASTIVGRSVAYIVSQYPIYYDFIVRSPSLYIILHYKLGQEKQSWSGTYYIGTKM